jgi:hypothetical protein
MSTGFGDYHVAAPTRLHVVYRSTAAENQKSRPPYYSKLLCLNSLLQSLEACGIGHEVVFLNDGPIPAERHAVMEAAGDVVVLEPSREARVRDILRTGGGGSGMVQSYLRALTLIDDRRWPDTDIVYLAEDDYLYRPDAFTALAEAARDIPDAAYFSLYASRDIPRSGTFFAGGRPWVSAVTTTSTFGARIGALRKDRWIHRIAWFASPRIDQSICEAYGGGPPFRWRRMAGELFRPRAQASNDPHARIRRGALQLGLNLLALRAGFSPHMLVTPFSQLATHLELPFIAAGTDWAEVARNVEVRSSSGAPPALDPGR